MRLNPIIAGLLMTGAAASALAQSEGVTGNSTVGKVDTVYVREASGLYFEKKLLRRTESKDLWVDVRFATALPGEPASEFFKAPAEMAIERGDLVAVRASDPTPLEMKLLPEANRVTRFVARHDTLLAMNFGNTDSRNVSGPYTVAQARFIPAATFVAYAGVYTR